MIDFVISGHSDDTEETFVVPYNVQIVFFANEGETCIVPGDKESLDVAYLTAKGGQPRSGAVETNGQKL